MKFGHNSVPRLRAAGSGDAVDAVFVLREKGIWKIGRGSWNDLVLRDSMVSRNHAMIQQAEADSYLFIDLGSRNGTAVNGRRVSTPVTLRHGDRISIGSQQFTFEQPQQSELEGGIAQVDGGDATMLMVATRLATVLVIDIRDFTGLSQRLDEATLAQVVGTWIRVSGAILDKQESWAQKYIGDAIMAVWIHLEGERHQRVLQKALVSLKEIVEQTAGLQVQFNLAAPVRLGAGINTSPASIGNVGSSGFADHTAMGDGVNKAFRLESATKQVQKDIVVGGDTFEHLRHIPGIESLFETKTANLKGYEEPEQVYGTNFSQLPTVLERLEAADGPAE